ncbi:hypothetical protein BDV98DRAFT_316565 [Pterulicium gracile]|uniref:Uncharacterized protein n=1 Tax=Pterulicium gracile TaxID=1884261 RepID=A0A5C3QVN6_9AGAR|nr:hypothetical protein BDV98DRAFT_316565 [Pterula gracilis]
MTLSTRTRYDLGGDNKCETVAHAVRPFGCYKDCCLNIAVGDFKDVKVRAKEVKDAALEILSVCHNADTGRLSTRSLERRAFPLLALVPALIGKWVSAKFVIMILGWVTMLYEGIMNALSGDGDEDARGEYVTEHVSALREKHPEFNIIMAHTKHDMSFEEPCYHAHVEFDRPFPFPGTIGYEIYLARRGNFTLTGDGGYQNWAYSGYISADDENEKDLTVHAPGGAYGWAAPVQGKYVEGGQTKDIEMIVSLSSPDGCATSFEVNVGPPKPQIRCTDIELEVETSKKLTIDA